MLSSNLFWICIVILAGSIEIFILHKFLNIISLNKRSNKFNIVSLILLIISLFLMKNVNGHWNIVISLIFAVIYYKVNYEVKIYKCVIIILIYWLILLVTEVMSMAIITTICLKGINIIKYANSYRLQATILSKFMLISIFILFKNKKIYFDISKKEAICIAIPLSVNMITLFLLFNEAFGVINKNLTKNYIVLVSTIIIGLSSIALIILIHNVIEKSNKSVENSLIKEKFDKQASQYEHIQSVYNELKVLKHDMKNHIICIEQLHGDSKISKDYIIKIKDRIRSYTIYNTGNSVIDIILNEKNIECIKHNIDFTAKVIIKNEIPIENMDLCSILANALDNAVEACCKINDSNIKKFISIKGKCIHGFLLIIIENTKVNKINICNNNITTDKQDRCNHGLGIDSIRKCVDKYHGDLIIDYTGNKFSLKISIPIKNQHKTNIL